MKKSITDKPVFRLAFCSVIAALETVLMSLSSLVPVGTFALPCIAGILSVAAVLEYDCKWGFGIFAVSAALSFFLSGDKEAVVYFIAIFGYYPVLKNIIERRIKSRIAQYIIKFAVFNAAVVAAFFVAMYLLSVPAEEYTLFGVYVPYVFLIFGNVFFIIYDIAIGIFVRFYVVRIRKILFN